MTPPPPGAATISTTSAKHSPPTHPPPAPDVLDRVFALHPFHAENADELGFEQGEWVDVVERDDEFGDGWWKGRVVVPRAQRAADRDVHGLEAGVEGVDQEKEEVRQGLFPASYVLPSGVDPTPFLEMQNGGSLAAGALVGGGGGGGAVIAEEEDRQGREGEKWLPTGGVCYPTFVAGLLGTLILESTGDRVNHARTENKRHDGTLMWRCVVIKALAPYVGGPGGARVWLMYCIQLRGSGNNGAVRRARSMSLAGIRTV
ncbi:hypothetical protein QFC21_004986 [Naganishia friedmannii]|uniref:Uncharacterized protein n=1 Tax=Naganishia friedmannii TaxID=89922 RepID=A0ACC2VDM1_9TREE|nr:hypothetical protein QFC21_004986 [Naganishia friedmannii]